MSESAQKKGRNLLAKFQEHKSANKTTILSSPAASEASEEAYFDAITDGSLLGICYSETKKKNSSSLSLTPGDNDPVHDVDSPLDMVRFALLQLSTMQLSSEQQPYGQSITTMLQGVEDYLERTRLLVGSSPLDTSTDTPHRGMSLLLGLSTTRASSSRRRSEGKRSSSRKALVLEQQQSLDRDHCDPTSSSITTPTVLQRSQRSILMENQLDLNETEMEYYEQIVNDLAEKLERMKDEKEEIQAISSMLGDRLLKITQQKDELLKSSTEELVQQRAAMEREMADLKSLLEVTRQDYRVELNKVFELESRIQVLREQLHDTNRKLALATDRNEALTQQITALGSDLQALKSIRDAQTSEGEMLQHQLMQHQVSIKALELQLNQYSQSEQHMASQLQVLQLKATEADELRHQVSGLRDSNAYLQESIAQARFRSDDPLREVELADLRELVEDLKAELEDSQAEVDSLSGVVENLRLQLELTSDPSIALEEVQAALTASREEVRRLLAENEALQLQQSNASDAKRQMNSPQYSDRRLDNLTVDQDQQKEHQLNTIRSLQRSLERSEAESADRLEEVHRLADEVRALEETVARQQELLQMDDSSPSSLQIQMMRIETSSPGALPRSTAEKQLTTPHLLEKLIDENEALHERVRGLEAGERLDQLTQSEVEYYEDAINGLAEQLEAVRSEREQLEAENRVAVEEINRLQRGGALSATTQSLNDNRKDESDFVINDLVEQLEALKEENKSMAIQLQQYSSAMDELDRLKRSRRAAAGGPSPRTDETNQFLGISSQWSEDSYGDGDAMMDASATRGEQLDEAANRAGQMDAQQRRSIQQLTDAVQQLRSQKAALKQALNQAALRIEDLLRSNSRLEHDLHESSTQLKIKTEQLQATSAAASAAATHFSTPLPASSRRDRDGDSSEQSGGSQQSGSSQQQSGRNKSSSQPELRLEQAEARIEALLADLRRAESSYDRMKLDFDKLHIRFQSKLKLSEEQALDIDHLRKEIDALLEENDKLAFKEMKASTSFRLKEIDYDGEVEVLQAQLGEQEALNTSLLEELRSKEAALLVETEASSSLKEILRKMGEQNDATEQLLSGLRSDRDSAAAQVEALSQQLALHAEWVTASEQREAALNDQIEDLQAEVDRLHDHIEGMQVGMDDEAGSLHHRLQVLNDENQSNDESLRTASKRIESLEDRCSLCDAELLSTKHLLRTNIEALAQHINRLSYMEAQFIKQVQMKVADQDRRIHVAATSVTTAFVDLNEFIASLKAENEELLRSLDDTKSALDRALDQHELDEDEKQFAWGKYDEVHRQEKDLQEELDRLNDQLALRRDAQSALQDHQEEMARLETRLQQAEQQVEAMSAENARVFAKSTRVAAYLEGETNRLKTLVSHLRVSNVKLSVDLKNAQTESMRTASLEHRLKISEQDADSLGRRIHAMEAELQQKEMKLLEAANTVADDYGYHHNEMLEGKYHAVTEQLKALQAKQSSLLVELNNYKSIAAQSEAESKAAIETLGDQHRFLESDLQRLQSQLHDKEVELRNSHAQIQSCEFNLSKANAQISQLTDQGRLTKDSYASSIAQLQRDLSDREETLRALEDENRVLRDQVSKLESDFVTRGGDVASLLIKRFEDDDESRLLRVQLEESRSELLTKKSFLAELEGRLQTTTQEVLFARQQETQLRTQLQQVTSRLEASSAAEQELQSELDIARADLSQHQSAVTDLQEELRLVDLRYSGLEADYVLVKAGAEALESRSEALTGESRLYRQQLDEVTSKLGLSLKEGAVLRGQLEEQAEVAEACRKLVKDNDRRIRELKQLFEAFEQAESEILFEVRQINDDLSSSYVGTEFESVPPQYGHTSEGGTGPGRRDQVPTSSDIFASPPLSVVRSPIGAYSTTSSRAIVSSTDLQSDDAAGLSPGSEVTSRQAAALSQLKDIVQSLKLRCSNTLHAFHQTYHTLDRTRSEKEELQRSLDKLKDKHQLSVSENRVLSGRLERSEEELQSLRRRHKSIEGEKTAWLGTIGDWSQKVSRLMRELDNGLLESIAQANDEVAGVVPISAEALPDLRISESLLVVQQRQQRSDETQESFDQQNLHSSIAVLSLSVSEVSRASDYLLGVIRQLVAEYREKLQHAGSLEAFFEGREGSWEQERRALHTRQSELERLLDEEKHLHSVDEQKLESCLSDLDALQLRMRSVEDSNSSLADDLKVSTAEMEELRLLLHEKDSSCIDLRAKLGVEQEQLQRSEEQLRVVQEKLEDVQRKVTEQELRFEHSNTLLNRLRVEKDALENVRRSMESELDRSRKEVLSLRDAVKQLHEDNRSLFEVEKVLAAVSATVDQIAQLHHIGGGPSTRAAEEQQSSALVLQVSSSSLHPPISLSTSTTVHDSVAADRSFVQQLPGRVELVIKKLSQLRNWAREEARNKRLFDSTQESISADLMSARSAEEEAQRQLQTARLHCIQLDKDLKQSLMELHHCRQEMSDMKDRLSKLDHSGSSVSALLEHEKQHASSLEEQARLRDASIASLHMELEDTKTQLSKSQDHLRVLTQKLSEVTSESDRRSEHLRIAKSNYEILFNTITQIEKNALSERVEREQTERKYGEAVEQISVLTRYQQRTVELERQVVQMREEVESTSQAVICSEEKCSKLQSSLSTAQKTIGSLEHRMESLLQQKNSFVDEVSETRKKIALAKQAAEQERMQRLKADAEIALLKKTEEANREHRVLVGRESNASDEVELLNTARGEEERRSLRTKILELNQVCEEQESKLQSDMNDRLKLEHEVKQLKSTLAKRNAELSSSSSYKSLLRSEGRQARQTVLQAVSDIRDVLTMVRIDAQASGFDIGSTPDSTNGNKRPATSSRDAEGKEMSYEDALPLGLAEALGINDLTLSLDALKAAMSFISESTRSYQVAEQHLKQLKHENTDLLHELQVSEQQRHDLVSQYKQEVQTMHLHITELRRSDSKNPHLVHQISELEASLKAERERRERAGAEVAALKARVELLTKLDSASNQHTHQGSGYSPDLQEALREEVDRMKSEHSDLLHELHAVNHHRTVLRDTLEQLDREVKAKGAALSELQLLHSPVEGGAAAKSQHMDGDDELRRRAVRYKVRSEAMDELATIYRSGVLALYPDGASYGAAQYGWQSMSIATVKGTTTGGVIGVGWIEREMNVVKHSYEAEMKLLDAEVGEVRNKLRQANLYTAELRRRFEDNMRAIYRSGKGSVPDGGLLLEQVDEMRAEIDRVSQERAQSMQELQQERTHSRQRHQQLVDSITAALQSRDASLGALHRLELFCRDQGLDISGLAVYEALKAETRTSSLDISKVPSAPRQQQQVLSTLMKGLVEADHDLAESERRSRAKRQGASHPAAPAATIFPVSTSLLYANSNNTRSATSLSRDSSTHNSRSNSAARGSRVVSAGHGQPLTDDSRQLSPAAPTTADDQQRQAYMQRDRGSPSHEQQLTREFLQSKAPAASQRQDPPPVYSLPTVSGGSGTLRVIHSSTPVAAARQSTGSSAKAHRSSVVPGK